MFDYNPNSIKSDLRAPVLYLRPFKADEIKFVTLALRAERAANFKRALKRSAPGLAGRLVGLIVGLLFANLWAVLTEGGMRGEELLIEPFEALGPVFAIGRPGEKIPPLGVVHQEIVVIASCSGDGRLLVEAGVWSMPVVLMGEG